MSKSDAVLVWIKNTSPLASIPTKDRTNLRVSAFAWIPFTPGFSTTIGPAWSAYGHPVTSEFFDDMILVVPLGVIHRTPVCTLEAAFSFAVSLPAILTRRDGLGNRKEFVKPPFIITLGWRCRLSSRRV